MARKARSNGAGAPFSSVRNEVERMIGSLRNTAPATQSETERALQPHQQEMWLTSHDHAPAPRVSRGSSGRQASRRTVSERACKAT